MESRGKGGDGASGSGGSGPSSAGGRGSWAQVVGGRGPAVEWTSSPLSSREVEELESFFSSALVLPVGEIGEEKEKWVGKAIILRSLGRRVPPEWAGRDMRRRLGLGEDPEVTPIAEDHFLVRFEEEVVCARAIQEAPWVVAGQLLAMEPWRPAFVPARRPVSKVVVWLRLPGLPMECWRPSLILAIAAAAGKPLSLDSFTEKQRRKGFARVKVEIDSGLPVKPGVVVEAGGARFWQQFQFENLPAVCFLCGLVGHVESGCARRERTQEGGSGGEEGSPVPGGPRLGPWISTSRIRQPRVAPSGGSRWAGPGPGAITSSGPSSSSPVTNPRSSSSPPGSPPDSEGWQKPAKVARRVRAVEEGGGSAREGKVVGGAGGIPRVLSFAPLSVLGDPMEESLVSGPLLDCSMAEPDHSLMKRPRSPTILGRSRPASGAATSTPASSASSRSSVDLPTFFGSSQGSSPGSISVSAPPSEGEVPPFHIPCVIGAGLLGVGGAGERDGGVRMLGGDDGLVPVEVREVPGVRQGGGVLGPGPVGGERGVGGDAGEIGERRGGPGGLSGGVVPGGGGLERGKEALVVVGVREMEALGLEALGGGASEREERRGQGGGRAGRGRGAPAGGSAGWAVEVEAVGGASSRVRGAAVRPRVRSRSPGGERRREGMLLRPSGGGSEGLEGGFDGEEQQGGEHALAVEGVRGVVLVGDRDAGVGPECGGASGSC